MRFTRDNLNNYIKTIVNPILKDLKTEYHIEAEGRNGYTGVDLFVGQGCERTLGTGTPKECAAIIDAFLVKLMYFAVSDLTKE